jgi:hypothetical protein
VLYIFQKSNLSKNEKGRRVLLGRVSF